MNTLSAVQILFNLEDGFFKINHWKLVSRHIMAFHRSKVTGYVLSFSVLIYFKITAPFVRSIPNDRINFYNKHLPSDPSYKNELINILLAKIIAFLWRRKTIIYLQNASSLFSSRKTTIKSILYIILKDVLITV